MSNYYKIPGVLILEGHVQGLSNTRSLGEAGIPVYVVDRNDCIARYSKYCVKFFKSPEFIKDDFADFLIDLAEREKTQNWLLLPSNDHAVYTLSKHKERLEKYYKLITPPLDQIENIYDKIKLIDIASKVGIPVPQTYTFSKLDDALNSELRFPVITKGRNGLSFYKAIRKKALLAYNYKELGIQLELINNNYSLRKSFTQELIPDIGNNNTISFTAFCETGEIKTFWMGEKLREHPLRFGTATCAKSVYIEECFNQSGPLLKALRYTGVCEVEYLKDPRDNQYKLIEINARTWLWVGLARECGVDYAKIIYDYVNGNGVVYPKQYETNKYWINPFSDTVYSLAGILNGKINFKNYLNSVKQRDIVNAVFAKEDMRPGIQYLLNIFSYLKNR